MSISLTLINKPTKERRVVEVISAFTHAVNDNYTQSEKETYVSKQGKSCLSILFQAEGFKPIKRSGMITQSVGHRDRGIVLIKKTVELDKSDDFVETLDNVASSFVVLELTRMISGLETRPPWTLSGGQLVFPVGMIGMYFKKTHDSLYKNDSRGLKFAKGFSNKDQSEIATSYYEKFVNEGEIQDLTKPETTGLIHFTTIVAPEKEKLRFFFLQNQMKAARYFFEPDVMFCSNEIVARSARHALYPNLDIPMRGNLRFYEVSA